MAFLYLGKKYIFLSKDSGHFQILQMISYGLYWSEYTFVVEEY